MLHNCIKNKQQKRQPPCKQLPFCIQILFRNRFLYAVHTSLASSILSFNWQSSGTSRYATCRLCPIDGTTRKIPILFPSILGTNRNDVFPIHQALLSPLRTAPREFAETPSRPLATACILAGSRYFLQV